MLNKNKSNKKKWSKMQTNEIEVVRMSTKRSIFNQIWKFKKKKCEWVNNQKKIEEKKPNQFNFKNVMRFRHYGWLSQFFLFVFTSTFECTFWCYEDNIIRLLVHFNYAHKFIVYSFWLILRWIFHNFFVAAFFASFLPLLHSSCIRKAESASCYYSFRNKMKNHLEYGHAISIFTLPL